MQFHLLLLVPVLLPTLLCSPSPDASPMSDLELRAELEVAVADSANLADELGEMLRHLQDDENEDGVAIDDLAIDLEKALKVTEQLAQAAAKEDLKIAKKSSRILKKEKLKSKKEKQIDLGLDLESDLESELEELLSDYDDLLKAEKIIEDSKKTLDRRGKSLFDDSDSIPREGKSSDDEDESRDSSSKYGVQEENETCESKTPSNKIKYCTPNFDTRNVPVNFYGQETYDEEFCYQKSLTECEEIKDTIEKEVCTYAYKQTSHAAPAATVQLSLETHHEKFLTLTCKHVKSEHYGKPPVEVCEENYVSQTYRLPVVDEEFLELLKVSYPEPEKVCQKFFYKIPDIDCQEKTEKACVKTSHLRDAQVKVDIDEVILGRKQNCVDDTLELDQQLCTLEKRVKGKAPKYGQGPKSYGAPATRTAAGYGAPRAAAGYGAPRTAAGYGAPRSAAGYGAPRSSYGGGFTAFRA